MPSSQPLIKTFANIELNATPTENSHVVPLSYLNEHFLKTAIVAPVWASNHNYSLGELVLYEGSLYKSTINHNTYVPSSLNGWETAYLTDIATNTSYGLVRPDSESFNIRNGVISLKPATATTVGGVRLGSGLTATNGVCSTIWSRKEIAPSFSGRINISDNVGVYCVYPSSASTSISLLTSGCAASDDYDIEITLLLVQPDSATTYSFPNSVSWLGSAPSLTSSNTVYVVDLRSYDMGEHWYAEYRGTVSAEFIVEPDRLVKSSQVVSAGVINLYENKSVYIADITSLNAITYTINSSGLDTSVATTATTTPVILFDFYLTAKKETNVTFTGVSWLDLEMPVFVWDGTYLLSFASFDGGLTWLGSFCGLIE